MSHTHRGPRARAQNDPRPRQQTDSGSGVWGERGVRERRGPQLLTHPHSLRQSWWMNKGPGCDSALPRPHPTSRQMFVGRGCEARRCTHKKKSEMTFYRAVTTTAHTLKNNTKVRPSYLINVGGGMRSVHRHSLFSKHRERRRGKDYCYPHDDGLKNRPFIHHQSTITQCTHHFHAVILMVSSTWLRGAHMHGYVSKHSIIIINMWHQGHA